jgi:hypothetical protein
MRRISARPPERPRNLHAGALEYKIEPLVP